MKSQVVTKTVYYKRATYLQGEGNLQADLKKALGEAQKVGERKQIVNAAENTFLLLNSIRHKAGMTFGSMLLYSRDRNQQIVTENDNADELEVEQMAPPKDAKGARRDFIESLLFFGVQKNHVVLLQTMALRARALETHLGWLLQEKTKVLSEDDSIALADQPSKNAIGKVLKAPVKSVAVGMPLQSEPVPATATKQVSFKPVGAAFDVIKNLLGADQLNKLKLHDSLDHTRLKVEVRVTYNRRIDETEQDLLNTIAIGMRNQEPDDVRIKLRDGAQLTGHDLKVSGPIATTAYGGLVVPDELYPQMRDWLRAQLEQGIVDP